MKVQKVYRIWHVAAVVFTVLFAVVMFYFRPALGKDTPTLVGSIGSFITLYAALFAVIELWRARSAVHESTSEARRVFSGLNRLVEAERITACQSSIKDALICIERNSQIPTATVAEIVQVYSRVFHKELADPASQHRVYRSHIEGYQYIKKSKPGVQPASALPAGVGPAVKPYANTQTALLAIISQFSEHLSKNSSFVEIST
ncbi:hypothetical protein [Burkholderia glumae]|uniref:DUF4760 domain-containing protein n=1 Tax=Burkholderia glumae TaxID=337 RepID=A0ABY5BFB3_BURGL|nr:hypothetical protein [Burkholderia glumae]USS45334.1 hypothetical protein NFI99_27530 [Burkholderia glumae]